MSRTSILVLGAISWSVAAADAAYHLATGDFVVPAVMAAIVVVWVGLRRHRLAEARAALA